MCGVSREVTKSDGGGMLAKKWPKYLNIGVLGPAVLKTLYKLTVEFPFISCKMQTKFLSISDLSKLHHCFVNQICSQGFVQL